MLFEGSVVDEVDVGPSVALVSLTKATFPAWGEKKIGLDFPEGQLFMISYN